MILGNGAKKSDVFLRKVIQEKWAGKISPIKTNNLARTIVVLTMS